MRLGLLIVFLVASTAFSQVAPNFRGDLLSGRRTSLRAHLKDNRVLFLSFWASWCVPCLEELTQLKEGLAKETRLPLDVLTVNVDTSETSSDVRPTIRAYGIPFPVISDPSHRIFNKFKKQMALPYSVLINSKGEVVERYQGLHDGMFGRLKKKVEKLVGVSNAAKTAMVH